jgi:serine/threonine protein kinase
MVLRVDTLIDNRYRLQDRLASGGMGEVWRATDESLGRTVAVKVLRPELLADPTFSARFRAEARMLAALHHPGVVGVYDFGEGTGPDGAPVTYLVMEYVEGEPLSRLLARGERPSTAETLAIVARAAGALHAAHIAGIVHRDVKPGNLLLQADGSVVLVDFGIARSTSGSTSLTTTNAIVGTAKYMAPEQASGQSVSPATDIYALGAVAYHCLAGHPPFTGDNPLGLAIRHVKDAPPALPDDVPEPVRELVGRALNKDPADRYPSAAAFADAARAAGAGEQPAVPAAVAASPPARSGLRSRRLAMPLLAVAAAVALLLLGGLATLLLLSNRDQGGNDPSGGNVPEAPPSSASPVPASQTPQPGRGGTASPTGQPGPGGDGTTRAPAPTPRRTPPATEPQPEETTPDEPGLPTRLPTRLPTELPTTILPTIIPGLPGAVGGAITTGPATEAMVG